MATRPLDIPSPLERTDKRTCNDLGVCQGRQPACSGCLTRPAFAPGVIEHHVRQRRALRKWLSRTAWVLMATCTVYTAAFLAGYHLG